MHNWSQLIVPIIFLVLWGLKQILEREPPRPIPRPQMPGPRPTPPVSTRFGTSTSRPGEDVLVIRDNRPADPRSGTSSRRGSRGKPASPTTAAAEASRPRQRNLGPDISPMGNRSVLGLSAMSLTQGHGESGRVTVAEDLSGPAGAEALARSLRQPARLREAFLLNEILQPPVAMRGPRPRI